LRAELKQQEFVTPYVVAASAIAGKIVEPDEFLNN